MKTILIIIAILMISGTVWGQQCPEGQTFKSKGSEGYICTDNKGNDHIYFNRDIPQEPDCRWEVKRVEGNNDNRNGIIQEIKPQIIADLLNSGWEMFSFTERLIWFKRRVCE